MERVVGPLRIQTDFNVAVCATSSAQNFPYLVAEVTFDFKDEPTWLRLQVCCSISQQLIRERIHAATGLAAADGSDDDGAGEQAPLRDAQPTTFLSRNPEAWILNLP